MYELTGLWLIGYFLFLLMTPAQFGVEIFLVVTLTIGFFETIEAYFKSKGVS